MLTTVEPATTSCYLSRLRLNLRSRIVRRDLANSQAMHRHLLDAFPDATSRADVNLLYRVEAQRGGQYPVYIILAQATAEPDWSRLGDGYLGDMDHTFGWSLNDPAEVKPVGARFAAIAAGDRFRFRLRANPTKKYHYREGDTYAEGGKKGQSRKPTGPNGTRIPLFDDTELRDWIARKSTQCGSRLLGARWQPDPVTGDLQRGHKANGTSLTHYAVQFEGILQVADVSVFHNALITGIGPGKAYGFGLLSLAPASAGI